MTARPASSRDRARLARRLSDLTAGGVPIPRCIDLLAAQSRSATLSTALQSVSAALYAGRSLSDALTGAPAVFSPSLIGLVRAGEMSGRLDASLRDVAAFLETEAEVSRKIRAALVYPLFLLSLTFIVTTFLFFFVIPRFEVLFADLGQDLPWPTRFVLGFGSAMRRGGGVLFLIAAAAAFFFRAELARAGIASVSRIPAVGNLVRDYRVSRFARGMATFLRGGLEIPDALGECARLFGGEFRKRIANVRHRLAEGAGFADALRETDTVPPDAVEMIAAADECGMMDEALERTGKVFRAEFENRIDLILALLEPALIVLMGLVVGFAALAMVLPIFNISATLR